MQCNCLWRQGDIGRLETTVTWLSEAVVSSIRGEAWLLGVQSFPAIMQRWQHGSEDVHFQAVRWTVQVSSHNGAHAALHAHTGAVKQSSASCRQAGLEPIVQLSVYCPQL